MQAHRQEWWKTGLTGKGVARQHAHNRNSCLQPCHDQCGANMAPKDWNNRCTINEAQLLQVISDHATVLQRTGWKAMDPSQIAGHLQAFLKAIGKYTVRISKLELQKALHKSKLTLTSSEQHLLVEKIATCLSWVKRRLQDAGSGKRLPQECSSLVRVWEKHHFTKLHKCQKKASDWVLES